MQYNFKQMAGFFVNTVRYLFLGKWILKKEIEYIFYLITG